MQVIAHLLAFADILYHMKLPIYGHISPAGCFHCAFATWTTRRLATRIGVIEAEGEPKLNKDEDQGKDSTRGNYLEADGVVKEVTSNQQCHKSSEGISQNQIRNSPGGK
jgi:hypothetical protein